MKIAVCYTDVMREYYQTEEAYLSDVGADQYASEVAKYLGRLGHDVELIAGDSALPARLKNYSPAMAFNLIDAVRGDITLGSAIPGVFEVLNIPYTGAGTLGWSLGCNKYLMYELMASSGLPVPRHQLITAPSDLIDPSLRYPLFPKLNHEHSSIGVDENSVCQNERELRAKLRDLYFKYRQPVLVDEYVAGIELTAAVLEGANCKVYCVQRTTGAGGVGDVVTFDKKWRDWLAMSYTKHEDPALRPLVKKCFEILKMSDYARIDIRQDGAGRYYFIDPNCNPFFGPPRETHATYSIILDMYGVSFGETLRRLIENTVQSV